jgi:hypothetical protein
MIRSHPVMLTNNHGLAMTPWPLSLAAKETRYLNKLLSSVQLVAGPTSVVAPTLMIKLLFDVSVN